MGRPRFAAVEFNYKEIGRHLKRQFIHRLIGNDMLVEIIRELTKSMNSTVVTSEQILFWAKRVESQRAQPAIITILSETKGV